MCYLKISLRMCYFKISLKICYFKRSLKMFYFKISLEILFDLFILVYVLYTSLVLIFEFEYFTSKSLL